MKKFATSFLALALAVCFAVPVFAATQVGIVLPTKDEPRWLQDEARFSSILGEAGFTYKVLFSQGSSATEKSNIEALINEGIKVLLICPHDASAAASAVEDAAAEGIQVIAYDRLINGTKGIAYGVVFDSKSVGAAQGQYLIDRVQAKGAPLYLYSGAVSDENAFLFFAGAWKVLQPKVADGTFVIANSSEAVRLSDKAELSRDEMAAILGQITTDWDFNVAKSKAEAHLTAVDAKAKGDVFVLGPNDGTARAIADAFAADPDVKSYVITGQDAEIASLQYILDGKQSMTVLKDTRMLTQAAVKMASEIIKGDTVTVNAEYDNGAKVVPIYQMEVLTIDADTFDKYIIESGYYDASNFTRK